MKQLLKDVKNLVETWKANGSCRGEFQLSEIEQPELYTLIEETDLIIAQLEVSYEDFTGERIIK